MAKGRPRKKPIKAQDSSKAKITLNGEKVVGEGPFDFKTDPRLPNKSLFRPDEAADYFGYGKSTIYTWIDHGILRAEKYNGTYRIPREAILECRFNSKYDPLL